MAWANTLPARVEDIIVDGDVDARLRVVARPRQPGSRRWLPEGVLAMPPGRTARAKRLGDRVLMLVADYSTFELTPTTVTLQYPAPRAMRIRDVATGEQVGVMAPDQHQFKILIRKRRARLLLAE